MSKVLLINGSPHSMGCTYTALKEVACEIESNGCEAVIFNVGTKPISGCLGCGKCRNNNKRCVINDTVNEALDIAKDCDGFIFGSPVHYAAASGMMTSFMDRLFYTGNDYFAYKPAACVVSARRAGTTCAYDQLNKYLGISKMITVPAQYWNMVHGSTPDDVIQDKEGLSIMRSLGRNIVWLIKVLEISRQNGIQRPQEEPRIITNFIR